MKWKEPALSKKQHWWFVLHHLPFWDVKFSEMRTERGSKPEYSNISIIHDGGRQCGWMSVSWKAQKCIYKCTTMVWVSLVPPASNERYTWSGNWYFLYSIQLLFMHMDIFMCCGCGLSWIKCASNFLEVKVLWALYYTNATNRKSKRFRNLHSAKERERESRNEILNANDN